MGNNVERWNGTRLWVYRGHESGAAACLIRRGTLRDQQDSMYGRAMVPMYPNSRASIEPYYALLHALVLLTDWEWTTNALRDISAGEGNPYFKRPRDNTGGGV